MINRLFSLIHIHPHKYLVLIITTLKLESLFLSQIWDLVLMSSYSESPKSDITSHQYANTTTTQLDHF